MRFADDDIHLTVLTQAVVQDYFFLSDAAKNFGKGKFPIFFITGEDNKADAVMLLTDEFMETSGMALRGLAEMEANIQLRLFNSRADTEPVAEG